MRVGNTLQKDSRPQNILFFRIFIYQNYKQIILPEFSGTFFFQKHQPTHQNITGTVLKFSEQKAHLLARLLVLLWRFLHVKCQSLGVHFACMRSR